jgi:hypothetical protein
MDILKDYQICIPSYKRHDTVMRKTLAVLESYNVDPARIKVFVNAEEEGEYENYTRTLATTEYTKNIEVVKGVPTIGKQRNFIEKWYPEGTYVMSFDDDIEEVQVKDGEQNLLRVEDFERDVVLRGFQACEDNNAKTFGIYAASNAYFMKHRTYTKLCYIIASMYGFIADPDPSLDRVTNHGEDYEYSMRQYRKHGVVVRLDDITVKSNYYKEEGGLQTFRTAENIKESIEWIANEFDDLCSMYIRKSTGHAELKLRDKSGGKYTKVENSLEDLFS